MIFGVAFVFAASLQVGSAGNVLVTAIRGEGAEQSLAWQIILDIRLPRSLAAFAVGGLLAMAGVLMQALLKNPLADPYLLGLSGGAGLGGVAAAVLLPVGFATWVVPFGAGLGAMAVVLLVFGVAARLAMQSLERLILTGVAISAFCSAGVSLLLTFTDDGLFRGMIFWLLGDLNTVYTPLLTTAWLVTLLCALPLANSLNVIVLGVDVASSLGVSVQSLRRSLYWLSAFATGVAVAAGGMIGFVGLVVPHVLRLFFGYDHRLLIPASAIAGGGFLLLADLIARSVVSPVILPIGVVTAVIGSPLFVWMLWRGGRFPRAGGQ